MSLLLVGKSPSLITDCAEHRHNCCEVILNISGEGIARMGENDYSFSPGTVHVVPPGMPHKKTSANGFEDIFLHTSTLAPAGGHPQLQNLTAPLLLRDDSCQTMQSLMSALLDRYLQHPEPDDITDGLYSLVLRLIEKNAALPPTDPLVSRLIRVIGASYSDPEFRVTEALEATGFQKDYVRRRFQKITGITPVAYLRRIRIRYAMQLLGQKDLLQLSINEIALMCGYYDPSYFCRIFRQETGVPPSEYPAAEVTQRLTDRIIEKERTKRI